MESLLTPCSCSFLHLLSLPYNTPCVSVVTIAHSSPSIGTTQKENIFKCLIEYVQHFLFIIVNQDHICISGVYDILWTTSCVSFPPAARDMVTKWQGRSHTRLHLPLLLLLAIDSGYFNPAEVLCLHLFMEVGMAITSGSTENIRHGEQCLSCGQR